MKTAKLFFVLFASLILLAACGGSGEPLTREQPTAADGANDGATQQTYSVRMSIVDAQNNLATRVFEGHPLSVNVQVTDQDNNTVQGVVVTYVLSQVELANFNNDTGTALTNADGIATIQMTVGTLSGSGTITANVQNAEGVTQGFESVGTQQATPSSLELFSDAVQLASSGSDQIELIAAIKNQQNILLPDVPVSFAVNQNASLSNISTVTGDDGTARATLSTQNNKENRIITVIAAAGTLSQTLDIAVVGTEVNINGASSVILNDSAPITVVLSDSDGNGIANQEVSLSASIGMLDNTAPVTSENGQVTVNYTASQSGNAVVTATALNASTNFNITVQQDDFSFIGIPTDSLPLNTSQPLQLRWFKNNQAFANGTVTVTASRGEIIGNGVVGQNVVTTDANGFASVAIRSSFAGPSSISAVGVDGSGNQVTARASVEFVASTVDSIFVDATPDLIGPEAQTSTITAVLRDETGNLVKGKTVNFRLTADASGGSISPNTAITDSNGIASTVYTSNAVSGDNGVTIEAESDGVVSATDLTVGDRAFDISIGTGSVLTTLDNSTYMKEFAVFVTDASGRPVANAELTSSLTPNLINSYRKGFWQWDSVAQLYTTGLPYTASDGTEYPNSITAVCNSEDVNQNGRLDAGEDIGSFGNRDGLLTPGNVAAISFKDNISRTDEFGQATLQIRYPKQFGRWVSVKVNVFGQSAGSESMQSQEHALSVAAADLTTEAVPPPASPFGTSRSCNDTF